MSYKDRFKRAEMACELAHEDREFNTSSSKEIAYSKFLRLKSIFRDDIQELEFIALKKRYNFS